MKYETIDSDQIDDIMEGRDPRPPQHWDDDDTDASADDIAAEPQEDGDDQIGRPARLH